MISAIIITKNECQNIQRAIISVTPLVDEILVVDHNSTDGTPELAEEAGAKVIRRKDFPKKIDFSNMYNYAIRHTKYDKVFKLDADECIHEKDVNFLRLQFELHDLVRFQIFTFFPDLDHYVDTWFPNFQTRMFRKDYGSFKQARFRQKLKPTVHYKGKIDESNNLHDVWGNRIPNEMGEGEHYGQLYHYGWLNRSLKDYLTKLSWCKSPQNMEFYKGLGLANFDATKLTHPEVVKRFPIRPTNDEFLITKVDMENGLSHFLRIKRKKT